MDDDFRVTSEPYRLMPPRKRARSDIREALDAARVTGPELREALDAARGIVPEPVGPAGDFWSDAVPPRERRRLWRLGRALAEVEVWILIVGIVGVAVAVVGVIIAYLTLVKPG